MTNRYEDALNELIGYQYGLPDDLWETAISALKLAQEAEQLRKERSKLADAIVFLQSTLKFNHPIMDLAKKVAGE